MAEEKKDTLPEGWDKAEEVEASWFKPEKIGDKIKGTLIGKRLQEGENNFGDQWIYEVKKEDGSVWNVPISVSKKGTIQRLNSCQDGEIIGVLFSEEIPAKTKGFKPTKVLKVFTFGMDEEYLLKGKEVKEGEDEDIPFE